MALQDSTFKTTHVMDNEIIKANDMEFAFEQVVENVSKATQLILDSNQDFVINGIVSPYSDMTVQIAPIYGVCKSTGRPFGRTETAVIEEGFDESVNGRVDILEVQGDWVTYDNQQRAFNDPETDTNTYQYVNTKKLLSPIYKIVKGTEGSSVAPEKDDGWVKIAEITIRAGATEIEAADIKNITSDVAGVANTGWTTQTTATYNIGYISDVNERFRVQHNKDGTHKNDVINTDSLNIGTGAKQVNGNVLPIGSVNNLSIPNYTPTATDTIFTIIQKCSVIISSLYNAYLLFNGAYKFNGELSISAIADPDSKVLTNPLKLSAAGDGTATIKIGNSTVLSITSSGKLVTNGYSVVSGDSVNTIVTKAVTDALSSSISSLDTRVTALENSGNSSLVYGNEVVSAGTGARFNVDYVNIAAASESNVTLLGIQSVDGVILNAGDNVLIKNQTDPKENGIYEVSYDSVWQRTSDYNTTEKIKGKIFLVSGGNTNVNRMFYIPNTEFEEESFGTDDINFLEYMGTPKAVPSRFIIRDANGRAKVAAPLAEDDIARKAEITALYGTTAGQADTGSSGTVGTANTFARSDHTHPYPKGIGYGIMCCKCTCFCSTSQYKCYKVCECFPETGFALVLPNDDTTDEVLLRNVTSTGWKVLCCVTNQSSCPNNICFSRAYLRLEPGV